jgi:argininosuccinate lyase
VSPTTGGPPGSSKPWGGGYASETAPEVDRFTASLEFDRRLCRQDIAGSIAHARMLARQGIITPGEAAAIVGGLEEIRSEVEAGGFPWRIDLEDVHMNIEARLREKIGPAGGKLHTARSRNDQVALDMHLYVRESVDGLLSDLERLQGVLLQLATEHQSTILPGYTHLQRAQPVLLAHHLLAYFWMLQRDRERLADARRRVNMMPLGAGALAGTTFAIDPDSVARELGFERRYANSIDAVSDRDYLVETLAALALIAAHLSRLGEELVLWSTSEFGFLRMSDAYTTGSSIMPQKKNPVIGELLRGKTGRVYGALMGLLTVIKSLPLAYNTDLQEDKEGVFDAIDTVRACLAVTAGALATSTFRTERMLAAASQDYMSATDLADYLAARGVPFRDAHSIAGRAVAKASEAGVQLAEMPLGELQAVSPAIGADVYELLTPAAGVGRRVSPMGTGPAELQKQLALAGEVLALPAGARTWVEVG